MFPKCDLHQYSTGHVTLNLLMHTVFNPKRTGGFKMPETPSQKFCVLTSFVLSFLLVLLKGKLDRKLLGTQIPSNDWNLNVPTHCQH